MNCFSVPAVGEQAAYAEDGAVKDQGKSAHDSSEWRQQLAKSLEGEGKGKGKGKQEAATFRLLPDKH